MTENKKVDILLVYMTTVSPQKLSELSVEAQVAAARLSQKMAQLKQKKAALILGEVQKVEDKQIQTLRTTISNINE